MPISESQIVSSVLNETRVFPPPPHFAEKAAIKSMADYEQIYRYSIEHPEQFWAEIAGELDWLKPWDKVLTWKEPYATWFEGGKTNIAYNC
ncbi:acetyl-coenzyme A synthetase N-terminal domain-containing protein [Candidatus Rickettsiella viridis]|uniref:acetyl-coenzyme A synthetase N-terminal domain-containing protein n=1 Tax=Candidatus Rickettsiella viridis TaxID=676208 RepID=UPI001E400FE5|nr:acetyl-coenzyme A synthetase N-terminal domain-containing protein [Candidatus Rickettsiella viridis]